MATLRPQAPPAGVNASLVEFDPADWPRRDGLARWKAARREWCQATNQHPDLVGPLGDYVSTLRAERHARLKVEHGISE
jgi:hypothetical protein